MDFQYAGNCLSKKLYLFITQQMNLPRESRARLLHFWGPTKYCESTTAFMRSLMNSLLGPPLSTEPSPDPHASTKTTSNRFDGLKARLLKVLMALSRTLDLTTLTQLDMGLGSASSAADCRLSNNPFKSWLENKVITAM